MAVKKQAVSDADKQLVLNAMGWSMRPELGLESSQIAWKCNKPGRDWVDLVLDALLQDGKVTFGILSNEHERYPTKYWRLT